MAFGKLIVEFPQFGRRIMETLLQAGVQSRPDPAPQRGLVQSFAQSWQILRIEEDARMRVGLRGRFETFFREPFQPVLHLQRRKVLLQLFYRITGTFSGLFKSLSVHQAGGTRRKRKDQGESRYNCQSHIDQDTVPAPMVCLDPAPRQNQRGCLGRVRHDLGRRESLGRISHKPNWRSQTGILWFRGSRVPKRIGANKSDISARRPV